MKISKDTQRQIVDLVVLLVELGFLIWGLWLSF